MATHSSTLAWESPWMEEPGRLQSMGLRRVGHDWVTSLSHFKLSFTGEGNGNPLQCSCLENPRNEGAWWAAVYGVAQSRTWLKWLSSSGSSSSLEIACILLKNFKDDGFLFEKSLNKIYISPWSHCVLRQQDLTVVQNFSLEIEKHQFHTVLSPELKTTSTPRWFANRCTGKTRI